MARYLKQGDIVFDVGAHLGIYSLWASRFIGSSGVVHAFEPDPETYSRLKGNIAINRLTNVICFDTAISDSPGSALLASGRDLESCLISKGEVGGSVVTTSRIDDHMAEYEIQEVAFLKLDVEGFEWSALKGAERAITAGQIPVIQLEVAGHAHRAGTTDEAIVSWLRGRGFTMCRYLPEATKLKPVMGLDSQNLFAVLDFEAVQSRLAG